MTEPHLSVVDVAEYILSRSGPIPAMKLQRLCYYSQAWHLAWDNEALFPERIEAWANGPIIPELYRYHRGRHMVAPGFFYLSRAFSSVRISVQRDDHSGLWVWVFADPTNGDVHLGAEHTMTDAVNQGLSDLSETYLGQVAML